MGKTAGEVQYLKGKPRFTRKNTRELKVNENP